MKLQTLANARIFTRALRVKLGITAEPTDVIEIATRLYVQSPNFTFSVVQDAPAEIYVVQAERCNKSWIYYRNAKTPTDLERIRFTSDPNLTTEIDINQL